MKNTEGALITLAAGRSASFQLPIYLGVKSMSFSLFSNATCQTNVNDTGIMSAHIQHSQGRTLCYHGPVNQTAYGSPVHVYESAKPFNTTANYTITFDAFDDALATTSLNGQLIIRITFEYEPL